MTSIFTKMYEETIKSVNAVDARTQHWPLVGNPNALFIILGTYLAFVCHFGPEIMKNRKPMELKTIITIYNIGQILACIYLFFAILTSGWLNEFSFVCQPVDHSNDSRSLFLAKTVWWTYMLKLVELIETVFFVLRKKQNQVSKLHLYHHVSTALFAWFSVKYIPGGTPTFGFMINSFVHIIMYTYYLAAMLGGRGLQTKFIKWKRAITIIQMIQFCIVIVMNILISMPSCNINKLGTFLFLPNIFTIYFMFYQFYKKSYNKIE